MIIKNQIEKPAKINKLIFKKWLSRVAITLAAVLLLILIRIPLNWFKPEVVISPDDHFIANQVKITLKAKNNLGKVEILYTLDGSDPNQDSMVYHQAFMLNESAILKAALFKDNKRVSTITSHNFFVGANHQLPVVAINTEPENLWDPEDGIYTEGNDTNYENSGKKWQRDAELIYFTEDKNPYLKQKIGLRIHGGGTRSLPQKSLRIYADPNNQGQLLHFPLFPYTELENYQTLVLRNAGTDWEFSYMRDAVIGNLAKQYSTVDAAVAKPVVVYLNGDYWGIYYLRERFDENYFLQKYKAEEKNLAVYKVPHDVGEKRGQIILDEGKSDKHVQLYNDLLEEARKCKQCAHYNHFNKYIDMDSYIDYMIFEIHFANFDWPYGNMKLWNYQNSLIDQSWDLSKDLPTGLNGKFRWLLYDLDVGFGYASDSHHEIKDAAKNGGYGYMIDDHFPFRNFFYDPTFQENYFNRYANLLNTGLSTESVSLEISKMISLLESEMPNQVKRWKDEISPHGNQQFQSAEDWRYEADMLLTYAKYRPDFMRQNTLEYFPDLFRGDEMLTMNLNVNQSTAGNIKVHKTIFSGKDMPFIGQYFPHLSINLEAVPNKGYKFSHWQGDVYPAQKKRKKLRLHLDEDIELKAIFAKNSFL